MMTEKQKEEFSLPFKRLISDFSKWAEKNKIDPRDAEVAANMQANIYMLIKMFYPFQTLNILVTLTHIENQRVLAEQNAEHPEFFADLKEEKLSYVG